VFEDAKLEFETGAYFFTFVKYAYHTYFVVVYVIHCGKVR